MTCPLLHPATQAALREARFVPASNDGWGRVEKTKSILRRGDIALIPSRFHPNAVVVTERGRVERYLRGTLELMTWLAENQP